MITSRGAYVQRWRVLHGNAEPSRVVRGWLTIAYALARPLAILRVSPDLISVAGVGTAVAALLLAEDQPVMAAAIVVVSLIFDGLDGAVAILRERESAWGAVFDGFLDRIAEALWAVTLVLVGVPVWIAATAWSAAMVQEYQRAKVASLHRSDRPIAVSVCERPVRALVIASAVLMSYSDLPLADRVTPTVFAIGWLALQTIGALQVWRSARTLHHPA